MKLKLTLLLIIIIILIFSACTPATPQATQTPTPFATDTATSIIPTSTPTATATPSATRDPFSAEAVAFVPHSVEQIEQSVEVRSPITDPVGYKEDVEKVLIIIHKQILPSYSGDMLKAGAGQIGVNFDNGAVTFINGADLSPIASVNFKWFDSNGDKSLVPIYFLPAQDKDGKFVLSMTFSPTLDYINEAGHVDNPAPDWHLSEIIKIFPLNLVGSGSFETTYLVVGISDEFMLDYFNKSTTTCGKDGNGLGNSLWNILGKDGVFDRDCERIPLVAFGGQ